MAGAIELETTLAWALGAYTVEARLGGRADVAHLVVDTGSSTLAVLPTAYQPGIDPLAQATGWVQRIRYGGGSVLGPVLKTQFGVGHGHHQRQARDVPVALVESTSGGLLRGAGGVWGLAYGALDPAWDVSAVLAAAGVAPELSWPWPFEDSHELAFPTLEQALQHRPTTTLTPAFEALAGAGVVANQFALSIGRAIVHVDRDGATASTLAGDPLNRGSLVLGGGAEHQHLFHGSFAEAEVFDDVHYGVELQAIRIDEGDPVPMPRREPAPDGRPRGNAMVDTGCSFLVLADPGWKALQAELARRDPGFPELVARAREALAKEEGVPDGMVDPRDWPDLHLHLAAPGGGETILRVPASAYWPANALRRGQRLCLLMPELPGFEGRSLLGLPALAGRYVVFDRAADAGLGRIRFAARREGGQT